MREPFFRLMSVPLLVGLCVISHVSRAEEPRPRIGLVLAGGGARGGAHIGVLKVLEELRVPVDYVAGTSIGSLVGALYCIGYSPDAIRDIISSIPWDQAFRDTPERRLQSFRQKEDDYLALFPFELGFSKKGLSGRSGAITGTKIDFIFRSLTLEAAGLANFDQLRIPYRAIAMDLQTGEMVVLDHGDLARAMRASMSVPGVFTPVEIDGRILVDGGTVRNIPVDVARAMGAERIIAIDVGTPAREKVTDLSTIGVVSQTMAVLSQKNRQESRTEITSEDLLITPDLGHFSAGDFFNVVKTISIGEAAARAHADELRRFSVSEAEYAEFLRRQRRTLGSELPSVRVDSIAVEGVQRVPPEIVRRRIETRVGKHSDARMLLRDISRIWQLGDFESVSYRLDRIDGENRLVFDAREKPWGPGYVRFGLGLDASFDGDTDFRAIGYFRRANINRLGAEWKTVLAVGNPVDAFTEFYQPLSAGGPWFVAPSFRWRRDRRETFLVSGQYEGLRTREAMLGLDLGYQLGSYGEIRLGAVRERLTVEPTTTTTFQRVEARIAGPRLRAVIDQLDDPFFPTSGNRTNVELFLSRDNFGADDEFKKLSLQTMQAATSGRNTFVGWIDIGTALGSDIPFYDQFELGGFLNLSGFDRGELRGDVKALFSLADYWRLSALGGLGKLYIGAALQAGNTWTADQHVSAGDLIYSGTLFFGLNTKVSPVAIGYGLAEGGNSAAYFLMGRVF